MNGVTRYVLLSADTSNTPMKASHLTSVVYQLKNNRAE